MQLPEHIHFIGIGGAGMAPLAELVLAKGVRVSGSDLEENSKCIHLRQLGANICIGHRAENLPDPAALVVYSSAVASDNPERQKAQKLAIPEMRRGEFLAHFLKLYKRVAAISGSHGKSSISSLLSHILTQNGMAPGFMIGAGVNNGISASIGRNDDIFVTEADESDGTHTLLTPYLGIIPNFDADHSWSVGGEAALLNNFKTFAARSQNLLLHENDAELFANCSKTTVLPLPPEDLFFAGHAGFQAVNARLAVQAAVMLGCPYEGASAAASSWQGIARRMTRHAVKGDFILIEDYAHHPSEVACALKLLRIQYPEHHLRVIFQPHRYARLEKFFSGFSEALQKADSRLIVPVFAAWSESGSVNSEDLATACGGVCCGTDWGETARIATQPPPDGRKLLIAVLGAGDIENIIPCLTGEE